MYNALIAQSLGINPARARLVEAYLRLQYHTLDALSRDDIRREYSTGGIGACIDTDPSGSESLANSYGLPLATGTSR